MKKRTASKLLAASAAILMTGTAGLQAETRTEPLIASCAVCHGENGNSPKEKGIPSISRMSENSLANSLTEFKAGTRPGTIMTRLVKGLTDDEIKVLAKFYGKGKQ